MIILDRFDEIQRLMLSLAPSWPRTPGIREVKMNFESFRLLAIDEIPCPGQR